MAKLHLGLSLLAGGLLIWSCSKDSSFDPNNVTTPGGTGGDPAVVPGTGTSTTTDTGIGINTNTGTTPVDPDAGVRRPKVCDANGENCKCMNLASIGAPASKSYGSGGTDNTNEFESWLTTKSNASVTFFTTKPGTIDMTWLNNFDVILLQDLRLWTFTAEEQAAFQQWVTEGGGVIALSGYENKDSVEIVNSNVLLAGTGMSILADEVPNEQACTTTAGIASEMLVCPNAKSNQTASKCYCWGGSYPITEWTADHPIKLNVNAVGAFRGRAINTGTGTVVAKVGGVPVAADITVGKGKVFIFGDEWVTYTSQWTTGGQAPTDTDPSYNPCWDDQDPTVSASGITGTACLAGHVFQAKQFWYNSLLYVSPPTECDFVIKEPEVIPVIQ